jgi:hypothetical protein
MKGKIIAMAAILALVGVLGMPIAANAATNMRGGNIATIGKDEVIDSTVYLGGTTVTVAGTVHGDVYCAGQNVEITGTVEGDVICAGQIVNVSGTVQGDVRIAGQTVTVSGPVAHSLTVFGQSVTLAGNATVGSDATIFGSTLQLGGKIGRDAVIGGESVALAGTIARNVTISGVNSLALVSGAHVGGTLDYTSSNEYQKSNGVTVVGRAQRHDPPVQEQKTSNVWTAQVGSTFYWFGSTLVLGLLLLGLAPRSLRATQDVMTKQSGRALLTGLVALVMTPIVVVMLMVTFLGIPAAFALLLLWVVALITSFSYSSYTLGDWLVKQASWKLKWPHFMALLLGLVVLAVLMLIPFVGGLFGFLAMVWGLGGLILMAVQHVKNSGDIKKAKA